jgi:hypothetical protein
MSSACLRCCATGATEPLPTGVSRCGVVSASASASAAVLATSGEVGTTASRKTGKKLWKAFRMSLGLCLCLAPMFTHRDCAESSNGDDDAQTPRACYMWLQCDSGRQEGSFGATTPRRARI